MILTKAPWVYDPNGDRDREDITPLYKAKEGKYESYKDKYVHQYLNTINCTQNVLQTFLFIFTFIFY